ncbi:hypothetical protein EV421DRAFT_1744091 [Armillaria borealis]|uniref:Uncharacterized protein n=1 Tax=Armillaria borealis TaxID=47425 RepID=A0AA39IVM8_9AGAR|nr:hypothetical protein EV421DRAFT_1744091 [Armillaria borealis]
MVRVVDDNGGAMVEVGCMVHCEVLFLLAQLVELYTAKKSLNDEHVRRILETVSPSRIQKNLKLDEFMQIIGPGSWRQYTRDRSEGFGEPGAITKRDNRSLLVAPIYERKDWRIRGFGVPGAMMKRDNRWRRYSDGLEGLDGWVLIVARIETARMLRIKSEGRVLLKPNVMIYEPGDVFWRERRRELALVDGAIGNDEDAPPRIRRDKQGRTRRVGGRNDVPRWALEKDATVWCKRRITTALTEPMSGHGAADEEEGARLRTGWDRGRDREERFSQPHPGIR